MPKKPKQAPTVPSPEKDAANTAQQTVEGASTTDSPKEIKAIFGLQRVFAIDTGLKIFNAPKVFKSQWNPTLQITLDTKAEHLESKFYFSTTNIGIKGALEEQKEAFDLHVSMGGIFEISGLEGDLLDRTLYVACPSIVFPYTRELVDSLMIKASFPPLMLAPIDFESLYRQNQEKRKNTPLSDPGDYRPKMPS